MKRNSKHRLRIFLGPIEIAGYYTNLKLGFDELGVPSKFVNLKEHPFHYKNQRDSTLIKVYRHFKKARTSVPKTQFLKRNFLKFFEKCSLLIIFSIALLTYDVFIFGFGKSFFPYWDLPILKGFGKKIIFVFHGSDARPPFIANNKKKIGQDITASQYSLMIKKKKRKLSKVEKYADIIISQPFISHFFEKPLVNWLRIGIPYAPQKIPIPVVPTKNQESIRILHSPSNPEVKGTAFIRQAISNLKRKGYSISYTEIMGMPNDVVIKELQNCDFVVDQLYSDIPMAAFATEAASFGRPTIIGGYGWEKVEQLFPEHQVPPSKRCHPDEIESAIEKLILDKQHRIELGLEAKEFVQKYWNPKQVAKRYCQLINGTIPKDWLFDPQDITYLHGAGLSEQNCKRNIKVLLENRGKKAFQLNDKPKLENLLIEFANS